MEIKEVKSYLPLLHSMHKCSGNCERNILMSHLDDKSFNFVCKWMKKSVDDPAILRLPPNKLRKLRSVLERDRSRIKYLTGARGNIIRKRQIVKQSGEGIGLLLGALAPTLIGLIRDLVKGKKK